MNTRLTARQEAILEFIRDRIQQGLPPTRGDIAEAFGFASRSAAEQHLRALAEKGAISLNEGRARGIQLVDVRPSLRRPGPELPLVGKVAAGQPILAQEHIETHLAVDPDCFRPRADYLLRVQGDSMIDAGIFDGDCLAVHRQPEAALGSIVVARIDDEVTVKRLQQVQGQWVLRAENPRYQPIQLRDKAWHIEGLVVGVLRRLDKP
ncbi:hypothetical protein C7S18_10825 [Ahniella affigens]|uniref:LexA repressor n=1 Tax=Ahniella affigens TaxID=2021234 RepID=A0A2P1PS35_9GAMM|nr:transcriptional repressor LexA [Ahniella affigens]AVP97663.1 hypothetical protein C7S18_10825 [Ahniella affigens]